MNLCTNFKEKHQQVRELYAKSQLKSFLIWEFLMWFTAWKVSKYGVFSSPYFPVFGLNTEKYGPEKTPYLDTFHAAIVQRVKVSVAILTDLNLFPY